MSKDYDTIELNRSDAHFILSLLMTCISQVATGNIIGVDTIPTFAKSITLLEEALEV